LRRRPTASHTRAIEATLADLAHEIRTPLTGILALGELLAASELASASAAGRRRSRAPPSICSMLTTLIVDAAAPTPRARAQRELIRPRRLAEALAASLAARAEAKGLEDEAEISETLPEAVIGDPLRLRAALEKPGRQRGEVHRARQRRARRELASGPRGKARLVFSVTDSGIGLTNAEIKRLFRPFAQASEQVARRYGGAGLGSPSSSASPRRWAGSRRDQRAGRGSRYR
jgi:signal transduction histidine kinase